MAYHPLNLALRFALELIMLWAIGRWGYSLHAGPLRWVIAVVLVLLAATAWGLFNVQGDPSRSGAAPVVVAGWVRLLLELLLFALAVAAFYKLGEIGWASIMAVVVLVHYALSWDRIAWLLDRSTG